MKRTIITLIMTLFVAAGLHGCAAVAGAGAAAGAYEYSNKQALDELDEKYEAGELSREEYLDRKQQLQSGSAIY